MYPVYTNYMTIGQYFSKLAGVLDISPRSTWNYLKDKKVGPLGLGMAALGGGYAVNEGNKAVKDFNMGRSIRMQQEQQAAQY